MRCPYCGHDEDKVVDTRSRDDGQVIRRRRLCLKCHRRFITVEEIEDKTITIVKSDNRRELYDRKKLIHSISIACTKRPVSVQQIEKITQEIEDELKANFKQEVQSRYIGELVIDALRSFDEVAYVRFASVYRNFKDKEEFLNELHLLEQTHRKQISKDE